MQVDVNQLRARLGRTGQIFVGGSLLVFILSFLPWYSVSDSFEGHSYSGHLAAWHAQFGAWFPVLLILALGVVTVLWAMGTLKWTQLFLWTVGTATAIVATVVILLRWFTYPSAGGDYAGGSASAGAGWALYGSLVVTVAMAVFGYLGFAGAGGDVKNLGAVFQGGLQGGQGGQAGAPYQAGQPYYQGGPGGQYNPGVPAQPYDQGGQQSGQQYGQAGPGYGPGAQGGPAYDQGAPVGQPYNQPAPGQPYDPNQATQTYNQPGQPYNQG